MAASANGLREAPAAVRRGYFWWASLHRERRSFYLGGGPSGHPLAGPAMGASSSSIQKMEESLVNQPFMRSPFNTLYILYWLPFSLSSNPHSCGRFLEMATTPGAVQGCVSNFSSPSPSEYFIIPRNYNVYPRGLGSELPLPKSYSEGRVCSAAARPKYCLYSNSLRRPRVQEQLLYGRRIVASANRTEAATPRSVPVKVAHELLNAGHRYLDVRTLEEFNAGHVEGAINVPYMFKVGEGMTKNPNFLQEVLSHFSKDDEIVVGCQSGRRSLLAATDLITAEFTGITDVGGGYSAWVQSGLPVEKK